MTRSKADNSKRVLIDVPPALRPTLGTRTIALDIVCRRGAEGLGDVIKRNIPVLDEAATKLIDAASACPDFPAQADVARLLHCANDLRGMAAPMGSEITAEIANAIYKLCEAQSVRSSKSLTLLLAEAARQVIGYRHDADNGDLGARIETLLAEVRASTALD